MNFLHPLEMAAVVVAAAGLSNLVLTGRGRTGSLLAVVAVLLTSLGVVAVGLRYEMYPALVAMAGILVFGLVAARRGRGRGSAPSAPRPGRALAGRVSRLLLALAALYLLAYPLMITPMLSSGYAKDLSRLGWTNAATAMLADLAAEYPFTEHKGLDWESLGERFLAAVAAAESASDVEAYRMAVRELVYSVPDGHVRLRSPDDAAMDVAVGGGFGLALGALDDGRIAVVRLWDDGPAAATGITWGSVVTTWNGVPVEDALATTPVLWAERPPSTQDALNAEQLRFLARAPVGTAAEVGFVPPGGGPARTVTLVAEDDGLATLVATDPYPYESTPEEVVTSRVLTDPASGVAVGYVRVSAMRFLSGAAVAMRNALDGFEAAGAHGVIIDLRGNRGGSDFVVAPLVAPFHTERATYHHVEAYDERDGRFEPIPFNQVDPFVPVITYRVRPASDPYTGPVAVIVDGSTASAAEGMAMLLARLPNVTVYGYTGTTGILGAGNSKSWRLPGGVTVRMLDSRSLDAGGRVQVDSDAGMHGGVHPDVVVPRTLESWHAEVVEERDVVLEVAVNDLASR